MGSTLSMASILTAVAAVNDTQLSTVLGAQVTTSSPGASINLTEVIAIASACRAGSYCPPGAVAPLPCPGGTTSNPASAMLSYPKMAGMAPSCPIRCDQHSCVRELELSTELRPRKDTMRPRVQ